MRRLLLSLLLLASIIASAGAEGTLTFSQDVHILQPVMNALSSAYADESISFESAVVTKSVSAGDGIHIITLELDGESYSMAVDESRLSAVSATLHELLQYAPADIEEPSLDYIYNTSYSSVSLPEKGTKGRVYHLKSPEGKTLATFIGESQRYSAVTLEPFYIKDAYTSLPLEKGVGMKMAISGSFIFAPTFRASGRITLSYLPLFYPFMPTIGAVYLSDRNGKSVYAASLGIDYRLSLGRIFDTGFTLIEDAAINASLYLLGGYNGSAAFGGGWAIHYEHTLNSYIFWFAGAGQDVIWSLGSKAIEVNQYTFNIGAGVLL